MKKNSLEEYTIPFEAMADFTAEEIYSLQMLGHIYNETSTLCKLTYINRGDLNSTDAQKSASMFHAVFFARLHAGKLHESHITINNNLHVNEFLRKKCFSHMKEGRGKELIKSFNSKISKCKWLSDSRNQDAMHFGNFEQLNDGVQALIDNKIGFEYIRGKRVMENLFTTSNSMVSLSFFHRSNKADWKSGLLTLIDDLESIQDSLYDLINESVDALAMSYNNKNIKYKKRLKRKDLKFFEKQNIHTFQLPYFFEFDE